MEIKLTEKQFNKALNTEISTRSELKRWKRAFYLRDRVETPSAYFIRLSTYRIPNKEDSI